MLSLGGIVASIFLVFGLSLLLLVRFFYLYDKQKAPVWW
jgi:hypothetical protein